MITGLDKRAITGEGGDCHSIDQAITIKDETHLASSMAFLMYWLNALRFEPDLSPVVYFSLIAFATITHPTVFTR